MLVLQLLRGRLRAAVHPQLPDRVGQGMHFTLFTSAKVQKLSKLHPQLPDRVGQGMHFTSKHALYFLY